MEVSRRSVSKLPAPLTGWNSIQQIRCRQVACQPTRCLAKNVWLQKLKKQRSCGSAMPSFHSDSLPFGFILSALFTHLHRAHVSRGVASSRNWIGSDAPNFGSDFNWRKSSEVPVISLNCHVSTLAAPPGLRVQATQRSAPAPARHDSPPGAATWQP